MLFRSGLLELLSSLGLVSKIVLLILLIFSIGSWTVILYKWRFYPLQVALLSPPGGRGPALPEDLPSL